MRLRNQPVYDKPEDPPAAQPAAQPAEQPKAPAVAGDPPAPPAASASPQASAAGAPNPETPAQPAKSKDWKDDRIASLTFQLNEERRTKAAAAATPAAPQAPGESDTDFARRVDEAATAKAAGMAAQADWDRQCNAVGEAGKKEFPDFMARLGEVQKAVNPQDLNEVQAYNEFVAAAIETGQAHRILYSLGSDPAEYQRLQKLSPVKRAMELGVMASKLVSSPEPSGAPKPLTPIAGGNGEHFEGISPDDPKRGMKLPKAEWMRQREKQVREKGLQ